MKNLKEKFSTRKINALIPVLIIMVVAMTFVNKNFLSAANVINILRSISMTGVMAMGMTLLLVGGEFDLSFGSTIGMTTVLVTLMPKLLVPMGIDISVAAILGLILSLIFGVLMGLAHGYFVTKFKLPAMLVTLSTQFVAYGIAGSISGGFPMYDLPDWWTIFGKDKLGGEIPYSVLIFLVVFVVFYVLMNHTKYGRTVYAIGGNAEAARLSGINVKKYKYSIFIIMQLTAVLAGLIFSSQVMSGTVIYGKGTEFTVISAVIIGGTALAGGSGGPIATLIGLLFLNTILNAMTIANIPEYPQYIVRGGIMLMAIVLSVVRSKQNVSQKKINQAKPEESEEIVSAA
jgi:ribose/xylose/arabinose/galactoside ABC-type transport system permease subunit